MQGVRDERGLTILGIVARAIILAARSESLRKSLREWWRVSQDGSWQARSATSAGPNYTAVSAVERPDSAEKIFTGHHGNKRITELLPSRRGNVRSQAEKNHRRQNFVLGRDVVHEFLQDFVNCLANMDGKMGQT